MDLERIQSALDTDKIDRATVGIVGLGASADLAFNLARSGVKDFRLLDPQLVEKVNVARQGHDATDVGQPKVKAVAKKIRRVNPEARVLYFGLDSTRLSDEEADAILGDCDLLVAATDKLAAQEWVNRFALRKGICALFLGIYEQAGAGEIIFWRPGLPCYRCLLERRFRNHEQAAKEGFDLDPPSTGVTIFDIGIVDNIGGQIALGLLAAGSNNRFGRLIERLGDRNFLQIKIDADWQLRGRDVIREALGIAEHCTHYVSWCTVARRNGWMDSPCPDCVELRGHTFIPRVLHGGDRSFHRTDLGVDTPVKDPAPTIVDASDDQMTQSPASEATVRTSRCSDCI